MSLLDQLTELALKEERGLVGNHHHLVNYIFVKDVDHYVYCENTACYYQMEHGAPWAKGITGIISSIGRVGNKNKDKVKAWLDFHTNDPIFGRAILSKDVDWMYENKMVISDTTAPGNLMQGVLVSIRQMWEYDQIFHSYYELQKSGINKTLAYNLAHYVRAEGDSYKWSVYCNGHSLFIGDDLSKTHLKNWLLDTPDNMRKPYVQESKYSGTCCMMDKNGGYNGNLHAWVTQWFEKIMKPEDKPSTNPFGKSKVGANKINTWNINELNAALKKHEEDMIKEITA